MDLQLRYGREPWNSVLKLWNSIVAIWISVNGIWGFLDKSHTCILWVMNHLENYKKSFVYPILLHKPANYHLNYSDFAGFPTSLTWHWCCPGMFGDITPSSQHYIQILAIIFSGLPSTSCFITICQGRFAGSLLSTLTKVYRCISYSNLVYQWSKSSFLI